MELKNKNGKGGKFQVMPQRPYNVWFDGCRSVLVQTQMHQPPFWNLVPTWCDVQVFNVSIVAVLQQLPGLQHGRH